MHRKVSISSKPKTCPGLTDMIYFSLEPASRLVVWPVTHVTNLHNRKIKTTVRISSCFSLMIMISAIGDSVAVLTYPPALTALQQQVLPQPSSIALHRSVLPAGIAYIPGNMQVDVQARSSGLRSRMISLITSSGTHFLIPKMKRHSVSCCRMRVILQALLENGTWDLIAALSIYPKTAIHSIR